MKRTCVVVVGMHRSGTSAFAGALDHLGINFGTNMIDVLPENPKGFFENKAINHLDMEILRHYNTEWYRITHFWKEVRNSEAKYEFIQKIQEIIKREFDEYNLFGIKEPRMCLFLPLYFEAMKGLNIDYRIVVIDRSNWEIASSLKKRNNFTIFHGILLSKLYKLYINKFTRKERVFRTSFEAFLADAIQTLKHLSNFHHLDIDFSDEKVRNTLSFIDRELRHNKRDRTPIELVKVSIYSILASLVLGISYALNLKLFAKPRGAKKI